MPFFVIVASSFSQFFIDPDEIGDRLGVAMGILLTFAAFQGAVGEELPQTGEMLLIDWYISAAYVIQTLLILEACLVSVDDDQISMNTKNIIEYVFGIGLGVIWLLFSFIYVSMWNKKIFECYGRIFRCCCKPFLGGRKDVPVRKDMPDEWQKQLGKITNSTNRKSEKGTIWESREQIEIMRWVENVQNFAGIDPPAESTKKGCCVMVADFFRGCCVKVADFFRS
eukprot:390250_1